MSENKLRTSPPVEISITTTTTAIKTNMKAYSTIPWPTSDRRLVITSPPLVGVNSWRQAPGR